MTVAETLATDEARANDQLVFLRGGEPIAEEQLRALLSGAPGDEESADDASGGDDGDVEVTNIVDFATWVSNLSAGQHS